MPTSLATLPKWLHIVLTFLAMGIVALTYLASKGNITLTAPVTALLGVALSVIGLVDPEAVAKTLPTATLARIVDQKNLALAQQKPPAA